MIGLLMLCHFSVLTLNRMLVYGLHVLRAYVGAQLHTHAVN